MPKVQTMKIALLHTADSHAQTFAAIFSELDPTIELTQHVRADLLADARSKGLAAVQKATFAALASLKQADAAICTCSTLGPLVDGFDVAQVLRIDRPLMEAACKTGSRILVCICLESTRDATAAVLSSVAQELGTKVSPTILLCDSAWPFFEAGDQAGFGETIRDSITVAIKETQFDCIALAQASMRVAEPLLRDIGLPVLSSPALAAQKAIEIARSRS